MRALTPEQARHLARVQRADFVRYPPGTQTRGERLGLYDLGYLEWYRVGPRLMRSRVTLTGALALRVYMAAVAHGVLSGA